MNTFVKMSPLDFVYYLSEFETTDEYKEEDISLNTQALEAVFDTIIKRAREIKLDYEGAIA